MNKKTTKLTAIFLVILFLVAVFAISIYERNKSPKYKPSESKEYSSYSEWKNKCIEINSKHFLLDTYNSDVIACLGSDKNKELNIVLRGEGIFDFNYDDFPELEKQIIISTTDEVNTKNQNGHQDWKLYKDLNLGFELRFPNNFNNSSTSAFNNKFFIGGFQSKNAAGANCGISVDVYESKAYGFLRMPPLGINLTAEKTNIDGQIVTKYSCYIEKPLQAPGSDYQQGPQAIIFFVLSKNGKVYEIRGVADKGSSAENQMREIIDTFKVI